MTAHETIPEDEALTVEQWQQVDALSRTLTPQQARWISGYFAGLDAGLRRAGGRPIVSAHAPAAARPLTILFGTETGNSRDLAKGLAEGARLQGFEPDVLDMADYKPRRLKDEKDLLIVCSTHGEGDPPQSAMNFFEFIEGHKAPKLESTRFCVLALGDSTYEKYCEAGKRLDRRLEELGGTRIMDRVDCDVDYDAAADRWRQDLLVLLGPGTTGGAPAQAARLSSAEAPAAQTYGKRNPFPATVIDSLRIVGRESTKDTRHIEIDIAGSGFAYEPGDALGVAAGNDPRLVETILEATGLTGAEVAAGGKSDAPLATALERDFEITAATPRFLEHWAELSGSVELNALCDAEAAAERAAFLKGHHVIDIVRAFPVQGLTAEALLGGLRPLQPRLYSIASSLSAAPDEAHLTLSPVRYLLHDEPRCGVASGHLADRLETGAVLPVYVQENPNFRLPAPDVPIIMIGAGTGVAPYRAFLQEREVQEASGRSWLFFGERNFRSDFLYQTEWQEFLKAGVLSRMDVAFSRDREAKVYVQHRLKEQAADLFAWLEEGAHIYVCGDGAHMAPDVHEALIAVIEEQGRIGRDSAEDYLRNLQQDRRYQRDVY